MALQVIRETTNKNFDTALAWVAERYPHLFTDELEAIEYVRPNHDNSSWLGLCKRTGPKKSRIYIRHGRYSVIDFIDTIVHELVHVYQYEYERACIADGRNAAFPLIEKEADSLAYAATQQYRKENDVPLWK